MTKTPQNETRGELEKGGTRRRAEERGEYEKNKSLPFFFNLRHQSVWGERKGGKRTIPQPEQSKKIGGKMMGLLPTPDVLHVLMEGDGVKKGRGVLASVTALQL